VAQPQHIEMKWKDAEIVSESFPLLAPKISISHSRGKTRVLEVLSKERQIHTGKMTRVKKQHLIDAVVYL
jgi:hypothetical protein